MREQGRDEEREAPAPDPGASRAAQPLTAVEGFRRLQRQVGNRTATAMLARRGRWDPIRGRWVEDDDEGDDGYSTPEIGLAPAPGSGTIVYSSAEIDQEVPPAPGPGLGVHAYSTPPINEDRPPRSGVFEYSTPIVNEGRPPAPAAPARSGVFEYSTPIVNDGRLPPPAPAAPARSGVFQYSTPAIDEPSAAAPPPRPAPPMFDFSRPAAAPGPAPPAPPMFDFRRPAPAPGPPRPPKMPGKAMVHSPSEQFSSFAFTHDLVTHDYGLLADMKRHGILPANATMKDLKPAIFRLGVKRLWGWTDADVDLYWELARDPATAGNRWKVEYLKGAQKDKREEYAITPGPTWTDSTGRPFDTSNMVSKASGPGYAIFVMSRRGKVFAGAHRVGLFHHSSFKGGKDVAAAGEIKVVQGRLKAVTAKSGHYMPGVEHTQRFLEQLAKAGADLRGVQVKVWRTTGPNGRFHTWIYDGEDLRAKGLAARGHNTKRMF